MYDGLQTNYGACTRIRKDEALHFLSSCCVTHRVPGEIGNDGRNSFRDHKSASEGIGGWLARVEFGKNCVTKGLLLECQTWMRQKGLICPRIVRVGLQAVANAIQNCHLQVGVMGIYILKTKIRIKRYAFVQIIIQIV